MNPLYALRLSSTNTVGADCTAILTSKYEDPLGFVTVTLYAVRLDDVVGVPDITPVLVFIDSPAGRVTELIDVGVSVIVGVNDILSPTVEYTGLLYEIVGTGPLIVRRIVVVPVPLALVASITYSVSACDTVGVPEITPVVEFNDNPDGSEGDDDDNA